MSSERSDPRSEQLNQIIADYLKAAESGEAPEREELIEQPLTQSGVDPIGTINRPALPSLGEFLERHGVQ